jgi:hypothetical protein
LIYITKGKTNFFIHVVVIVWFLDLQLPMQSVPITINFVSSNPAHGEVVFDTTLWAKVCQWLATGRWFSPGTADSSTNKTDHHDITEILLNVVLSTISLTLYSGLWCLAPLSTIFQLYRDGNPLFRIFSNT